MERLFRKFPLKLLLVLPALFYLSVAVYWQARDIYVVTGDEPNYLLITDSIVRDRDLKVENNYKLDTPVQRAIRMKLYVPEQMPVHVYNEYSRHNVGLPFLLALPYFIGGVLGSRIFMALLAGLWPLLLYRVLFRVTGSKTWSLIVAFTLGLGLPFAAAGNQIYPDLVAGMIIFYLMWELFGELSERRETSFSLGQALRAGFLIGFLPWLHIRFMAPAVLLSLAYTYAVLTSPHRRAAHLLRSYLGGAAIAVGLFALLVVYNQVAFGNPFGPYESGSLSYELREVGMTFLGLHWDQGQGMFVQQPLLLLGLVGLVPLIRANWRAGLLLGLVYLSVLLPNAMHRAWYGGFSFNGRFGWGGVALWVFPLAFAVKFLLERKRTILRLLCALGILLQIWYASKWVFNDGFLLNQSSTVWSARSFFEDTDLLFLLPTFRDFGTYLKNPVNILFVISGLLLIISGWLWQRRADRLPRKIWGAFAATAVCLLILIPVPYGSLTYAGIGLPSSTGKTEKLSRVATEKDGAGALVFGPYIRLLPGLYEARLDYDSSSSAPTEPAGRFDVVYGPGVHVVGEGELPPSDSNNGVFRYRFPVRESQSLSSPFEFRVWYLGHGSLTVKSMTITPVSFDQ